MTDATMQLGVWAGFMRPEEARLSSVSRLGGQPVYFPACAAAIAEHVTKAAVCGVCGRPLYLLLQCYCPLPGDDDEAFNRMRYVFCCNSARCSLQPERSWLSLAVTCSTFDAAADEAGEEDGKEEEDVEEMPSAPQHLPPYTFPAAAMDIIDEPAKAIFRISNEERHMVADYERRELARKLLDDRRARGEEITPEEEAAAGAAMTEAEATELESQVDLKNKDIDVAFDKFQRRLARAPSQVLRYQFGGSPLFMNPKRVQGAKVPPCECCGGPRAMELQLMPTNIFLLQASQYMPPPPPHSERGGATGAEASGAPPMAADGEGLDFATATVYVCANRKCIGYTPAGLFHPPSSEPSSESMPATRVMGRCGGDAEDTTTSVSFCIVREHVLVEAAPTLEEEMSAAAATGAAGTAPPPTTFREMMVPTPQQQQQQHQQHAAEAPAQGEAPVAAKTDQ